MPRKRTQGLTDREAEIMSILWKEKDASAEEIRQQLANKPSANTVRTLLNIMAERNLVADDGSKYGKKFRPLIPQSKARDSALRRLVDSLFAGSTEEMLVHLVDEGEVDIEQLKRLQKHIPSAEREK
jgi:BlaI family transcriptional regulator, penicillinase repressor